jgi:la-related protein 1
MSNSTTFSYAQAAKGQLAIQPAASQPSPSQSQPPSVDSSQNRDANNTNASTRAPSIAVSATSNDIDSSRSARSNSIKPDAARFNGSDGNQDDTNTTASVAGSLSSSRLGADHSSVDGAARNIESRGRSTNTDSDAAEYHDGKKGRKPKKTKPAENDLEAGQELGKEGLPLKVELSEAPIPTVNIWVQRQEAQKAKTADQISHTAGMGSNSTQPSTDYKPHSTHSKVLDSNKVPHNGKSSSKKDGEPSRSGPNQGPKRAGPRGARAQEKEIETNLLANNPVSWPTPQTAAGNLKTQPPAQPEKHEKEDKDDAGTAKPKKWVQLPNFVHTVKFETTLPGRGPRGGRVGGSRGGRDVAAGNHNTPNPAGKIP